MPRIFSYPDGIHGIAVLVLRLSLAPAWFPVLSGLGSATPLSGMTAPFAAILALQLALGFGTRPVALILSCATLWCIFAQSIPPAPILIALAGSSAAVALCGAGAYSVDARLFGRRVIHLSR